MAIIKFDSTKERERFSNDFLNWFYHEWDVAVETACNYLEGVLNDAALSAVDAYYATWIPKMYDRTYQLPLAYDIRVKPDMHYEGYDILNLDKIDVSLMSAYHSIYGNKRSLSHDEMESVVGYMLRDGGRPIPPHIQDPPYSPSYGPISIKIRELGNVEIKGNSVAEIVNQFDDLDDELEAYMKKILVKELQPGLNRFIRSWK